MLGECLDSMILEVFPSLRYSVALSTGRFCKRSTTSGLLSLSPEQGIRDLVSVWEDQVAHQNELVQPGWGLESGDPALEAFQSLKKSYYHSGLRNNLLLPWPCFLLQMCWGEEVIMNRLFSIWNVRGPIRTSQFSLFGAYFLLNKFINITCNVPVHLSTVTLGLELWKEK